MTVNELPYPLRLVVESLYYCIWANPETKNLTCSEIMLKLRDLYGAKLVDEARAVIEGTSRETKLPYTADSGVT